MDLITYSNHPRGNPFLPVQPEPLNFVEDTDKFKDAGELAVLSLTHELMKVLPGPRRVKIISFLYEYVFDYRLTTLTSSQVLKKLTETIFKDTDLQAFVLDAFQRFWLLTTGDSWVTQDLPRLIYERIGLNNPIIPNGLEEPPSDLNLIPADILESFQPSEETQELLNVNPWIVFLILIHLFLPPSTLIEIKNEQVQQPESPQ